MKFSSSLKFNAVAEWWEEYIAYSALKKHIYALEKQYTGLDGRIDDIEAATNERATLLGGVRALGGAGGGHPADDTFSSLLDRELEKIVRFYRDQEAELLRELQQVEGDITQRDVDGASAVFPYDYLDEEDEEDEEALSPNSAMRRDMSPSHLRGSISDYGDTADGGMTWPRRHSQPPHAPGSSIGERRRSSHGNRKRALSQIISDFIPGQRREISPSRSSVLPTSIWNSRANYARDIRMIYKRRITTLFLNATSLRSYVELNWTGFRKILKKYDKTLESPLQQRYLHEKVERAYPFMSDTKERLSVVIGRLGGAYAKCVTHGDTGMAERHLKMHQREHVVWERDTVWRQMIGQERRGETGDGSIRGVGIPAVSEGKRALFRIRTRWGTFRVTKRIFFLTIGLAVFFTLLNVKVLDGVEANNCFAILIFATILWATEAIPLFVTSILVPFLLAVLRTIRSADGKYERLNTSEATKYIFSVMFSPTIMLLIGGFTIASALSKTSIDRVLITRVLSLAGTKPSTVLLSFMGVSCFASMWISNVAAPTLCFTLIRPILRTLPPGSSFAPCLILAIALAANIGGQSSPISSPQNLIALNEMDPPIDWLRWFAVALPVSAVSIVLIWLLLLASYRPGMTPDGSELEIKPIRASRERFTLKQYWVTFVCLVTIGLWCIELTIVEWVGDMGVIAIIPILAFFSTGVLKKDDFEQFLWSIVFIAMGGSALGKAVAASGLLDAMDNVIRNIVGGLSLTTVVFVLSVIVLVVSTFISHTIASILLCKIAAEVGAKLPGSHQNLLVFLTALLCSTGMGMPVSGFPNQTAATQVDEMGQLYLTNIDFLKNGVPASIVAATVVATLGFALMRAIGL